LGRNVIPKTEWLTGNSAYSISEYSSGVWGRSVGKGGLTWGLVSAPVNTVGEIPVVNIFIGNGANGTASHPNGHNGGILLGSGGAGFDGGKDDGQQTANTPQWTRRHLISAPNDGTR